MSYSMFFPPEVAVPAGVGVAADLGVKREAVAARRRTRDGKTRRRSLEGAAQRTVTRLAG